jgi:N,N'-diacetyllegionaminate synthase
LREIKVGNRFIGDGHPAYIIAEIGINHNGDLALAKEMISAAWENGADAVKIQTFITKDFLHPCHPSYQHDIDAEISHDQEKHLWEYARKHNINLFSTPEEFSSLDFISSQDPDLLKIASMDFNYKELVQRASKLQKPIILSSGMSDMEEVMRTIRWVEETGNKDYMLLHCVSCYPASPASCNLEAITTLKSVLDCPIGFSDHTIGTHIPFAAICLGANIVEKHFTMDKKMDGPDQKISMTPEDLNDFVNNVRDFESARGTGNKVPAPEEKEPRLFKRRGIYANRHLKAGDILRREDVVFFAPSNPESTVVDWEKFEGRPLTRSIASMSNIKLEDI